MPVDKMPFQGHFPGFHLSYNNVQDIIYG